MPMVTVPSFSRLPNDRFKELGYFMSYVGSFYDDTGAKINNAQIDKLVPKVSFPDASAEVIKFVDGIHYCAEQIRRWQPAPSWNKFGQLEELIVRTHFALQSAPAAWKSLPIWAKYVQPAMDWMRFDLVNTAVRVIGTQKKEALAFWSKATGDGTMGSEDFSLRTAAQYAFPKRTVSSMVFHFVLAYEAINRCFIGLRTSKTRTQAVLDTALDLKQNELRFANSLMYDTFLILKSATASETKPTNNERAELKRAVDTASKAAEQAVEAIKAGIPAVKPAEKVLDVVTPPPPPPPEEPEVPEVPEVPEELVVPPPPAIIPQQDNKMLYIVGGGAALVLVLLLARRK